jgi:IS30 family transposase
MGGNVATMPVAYDLLCASLCLLKKGRERNTIGLIRQFLPKDRDLTRMSEEELARVIDTLNHRPRKALGFRAPHEVFFDTTTLLTVALTS